MKIKSKELINGISNLYNIVSLNNMDVSNLLNYNFESISNSVSLGEQNVCKDFNKLLCAVDIEVGEAELENRDIDKNLIKDISNKILEKINYYKYFIEIDLSQYSLIFNMTIKEYINLYANIKPDFSIELKYIIEDGIKNFGLNNVTIIDFIRQISIELKKSNILLFKDKLCYKDIEQSLRDWEKDKTDKWIFR